MRTGNFNTMFVSTQASSVVPCDNRTHRPVWPIRVDARRTDTRRCVCSKPPLLWWCAPINPKEPSHADVHVAFLRVPSRIIKGPWCSANILAERVPSWLCTTAALLGSILTTRHHPQAQTGNGTKLGCWYGFACLSASLWLPVLNHHNTPHTPPTPPPTSKIGTWKEP